MLDLFENGQGGHAKKTSKSSRFAGTDRVKKVCLPVDDDKYPPIDKVGAAGLLLGAARVLARCC